MAEWLAPEAEDFATQVEARRAAVAEAEAVTKVGRLVVVTVAVTVVFARSDIADGLVAVDDVMEEVVEEVGVVAEVEKTVEIEVEERAGVVLEESLEDCR